MVAQPTLALIDGAAAGTVFVAELTSLPYRARDQDVESELKKCNAAYEKIDYKRDEKHRLIKVKLTIKDKESAKTIVGLNKSTFLGRKLIVEFPDLSIDVSDLPEQEIIIAPVSNPAPTVEPAINPKPIQEKVPEIKQNPIPEPKSEVKPSVTSIPKEEENVKPKPKEEEKVKSKPKEEEEEKVRPKPKEEEKVKTKPKEENKPPVEIPKETKSVWDLDLTLQQDIIKTSKSTGQKQVVQTLATKPKKENKKAGKRKGR